MIVMKNLFPKEEKVKKKQMTVERYEPTEIRGYVIINDKRVKTIHLEIGKPRVRITLDKKKWIVSSHLADSGSI